ncbi:chorismate mutase [Syntrophobotulus glycolicus DSM 8271]|uniref:chorismate mutase n=1 Tax=Syntrophobotulus glycolicus (strain DSM 8271 / FlGlyR) TaxID=645991 RepID=F0SYU7_SYNGF|nr:chorismate mutase [Syntrophobotulus glycolicus]ADY55984.1 chorismate mutase [Syntrophobotulus glycolicus DSM 8271]
MRGIRGATTVEENTSAAIRESARELIQSIVTENELDVEDIVSIIFSVSPELNSEFPAAGIRELDGEWRYVPFFCTTEIPVPNGIDKCIRVLVHVNTGKSLKQIKHIYLKRAEKLRPDLLGSKQDNP